MDGEIGWKTQEQISFVFLEKFIEKWDSLLSAVADYLALWSNFNSNFKTGEMKRVEIELTRVIKSTLVHVASVVDALNQMNRNPDRNQVGKAATTLKEMHINIINSNEIRREQLEAINTALAVIMAQQFLGPLMRYGGGQSERTYGKTENIQ